MMRAFSQKYPTVKPQFMTAFWGLCILIFFAAIAARLGTDGTPDFKIYHYYNGFAVHHDRTALDIFPAQLQSTMFKGVDGLYYSLFRKLNNYPAILNIILSLPYAVAAFTLFLIARIFVSETHYFRDPICVAAAILGLTGAGALPTLATTMTDVVPGLPVLISIAVWLYLERAGGNTIVTTLILGAIAGFSVALKLTTLPVFVGLFAVIALRRAFGVGTALSEAIAFGIAGVTAFTIVDGPWLFHNYYVYGNPIFPIMNNVFKSDWVDHGPWTDTRFMPRTAVMALFYPMYWSFWDSHDAIELNMRDPRVLIGWLSAFVIVATFISRRYFGKKEYLPSGIDTLGFYLAAIFLISYFMWEKLWSIYRYLAIDEGLSGVMLIVALAMCIRGTSRTAWIAALFALAAIPAAATTHYPWWSRAQTGAKAVSIKLPAVEPNAMVIFLDPYAYSYLVPSLPPTVRAIGANNNIIRPGSWGKLQAAAEAAIRGHTGPIWGLEDPLAFPGTADVTLDFYKLTRDGECTIVDSNIEERPQVRMCRLVSASATTEAVRQLYLKLLGREPDPAGAKYWASIAVERGTIDAVRLGIMSSEEYRKKNNIAAGPEERNSGGTPDNR